MGLVTLTFELLIFKLVCETHRNCGTIPSKCGHARHLGSRIIRYVRDGQTDGQTDGRTKATLIAPFPTGGGIIRSSMSAVSGAQKP